MGRPLPFIHLLLYHQATHLSYEHFDNSLSFFGRHRIIMLLLRLSVDRALPLHSLSRIQPLGNRCLCLRSFTHDSQLLLVSGLRFRPQLPFLHPATAGRAPHSISRNRFQIQLARLLTTERKLFLKDQAILVGKYTIMIYVALGLINMISFGITSELTDRKYPPPPEWTFWTKVRWRDTKRMEEPREETGDSDWAAVGDGYLQLLQRLEDPAIDGAGIQPLLQEEGDVYVKGVGKTGLDIFAKSEPWRRGYYQCLIGLAIAAEKREGWVKDITRGIAFPSEHIIGPSNPNAIPVGPGSAPAPLEQNCELAFDTPATYYIKILTTQGFTSRQRLDAALAYANWLDFKGLPARAEDMYNWGLDIAIGALPQGSNNTVDIKTGIISPKAEYVSSNVVRATSALAAYHAHNGNIATALPIFLSVLRARRQATSTPPTAPPSEVPIDVWSSTIEAIKSFLAPPPYPAPPSTGDELPERTPVAICEEAAIMSNIGEILFASSIAKANDQTRTNSLVSTASTILQGNNNQQNLEPGLAWTRESVDLAEATLDSASSKDDEAAKTKCTECLTMGVENWAIMVTTMLENEKASKVTSTEEATRWFWRNAPGADVNRWEREKQVVDKKLKSVRRMMLREEQRKQERSFISTLLGK